MGIDNMDSGNQSTGDTNINDTDISDTSTDDMDANSTNEDGTFFGDDVSDVGYDSDWKDRDDVKFSDFKLSEKIVRALEGMNYITPTPVQKHTIEPGLERRDLIVLSKTGSGKTAAFGVPALQLLHEKKLNKALILAPTRELAVQVEHEIAGIAKYLSVKSIVVYGKHSIDVEIGKIKKGCDILVGTPGRVLDHIEQDHFNPRDFDLVILDEADRMLDMGFIDQVDKIISHTSKKRTTFLFSATIPEEIVRLSSKYLNNPYTIELSSDVKTVEEVEQYYISVNRNEKRSRLLDVLGHYRPESCIVFCNTRYEVDRVTDFLVNYGITSKSIHGANSQSLRLKFLNQFKKGDFRVLVATDVAARGLHIEGLELVVNYNLPIEKDSYVHRIGRTGRAGKKGLAISFVQEGELYQMYSLEEHVGVRIEEIQLPKHSSAKREAENTRDLYGISFRELSKYDPEAPDNTSNYKPTSKSGAKSESKSKSKSKSKSGAKPGVGTKSKIDTDSKIGNNFTICSGDEKQGETANKKRSRKRNKTHRNKQSPVATRSQQSEQSQQIRDVKVQKSKADKTGVSIPSTSQKKNRRNHFSDYAKAPKNDRNIRELETHVEKEADSSQKRGFLNKIIRIFKKGGGKNEKTEADISKTSGNYRRNAVRQ